ncbi:MAG TPA: hypothetical protein VEJ16_02450 [Alphaproteobacteria bacterium]|nr:hypothetical protein [Alphaproteobacteria bacterium]
MNNVLSSGAEIIAVRAGDTVIAISAGKRWTIEPAYPSARFRKAGCEVCGLGPVGLTMLATTAGNQA